MTTKDYLSQAIKLDEKINTKTQVLESLNDLATRCTATYSEMPKSQSCATSRLEDTVIKIINLQEEINFEIDRYVDLKKEIYSVISKIPDDSQRTLLEKRYLCGMSWENIAVEMCHSLRQIYRLHGEALKNIVIPENGS